MKDPNKTLKEVVSSFGLLKTTNKAADGCQQPYSFVCESRLQTQFLKRNPISESVARSSELLDCEFVSNPHLTDSLELNFKSILKAYTPFACILSTHSLPGLSCSNWGHGQNPNEPLRHIDRRRKLMSSAQAITKGAERQSKPPNAQAGGSVSSPSFASSPKPQWRCAAASAYESSAQAGGAERSCTS